MRSIHDNRVYAYCVLAEAGQVVLRTEYAEREPAEYTDVVFSGVLAHHLRHALPGNILFDIDEVDSAEIVAADRALFEQGKPHGWPELGYQDEADLLRKLSERGARGFRVHASYGLEGWVLAQRLEYVERSRKWEPA